MTREMTPEEIKVVRIAIVSAITEGPDTVTMLETYARIKEYLKKNSIQTVWEKDWKAKVMDSEELLLVGKLVHFINTGELQ